MNRERVFVAVCIGLILAGILSLIVILSVQPDVILNQAWS